MQLRPIVLERDLETALSIWSRAAKAAHPFIEGEGEGERFEKVRDVYFPLAESWVCEDAQGLVGFISIVPRPDDVAEIGALFVDPERQGEGAGRRLVEHAAALKGPLTLEVFESNQQARLFYRRAGFVEGDRRVDPDTGQVLIRATRRVLP